ncbi:VOC family protein [Paenilisteria weihenstephanensis]|uniref:hypothetical protein n=1 Tax=Listeria weihenstephanensis TaxID=1006155 RepID=UPI001F4723AA|nr:hypothetical protein [Listeria weihenstephanensis]
MIKGLYEAHLPVKNLDISLEFYKKLGLEVASVSENVAFYVEKEDMRKSKKWLADRGTEVITFFGIPAARQPLLLSNVPQLHASIYFEDPDRKCARIYHTSGAGYSGKHRRNVV